MLKETNEELTLNQHNSASELGILKIFHQWDQGVISVIRWLWNI